MVGPIPFFTERVIFNLKSVIGIVLANFSRQYKGYVGAYGDPSDMTHLKDTKSIRL